MVTTKAVYYYEPAKYLSHLKLVVTSSSSYYIQVDLSFLLSHRPMKCMYKKFNTGFIQDHGRGKRSDRRRNQRIMREIGRP